MKKEMSKLESGKKATAEKTEIYVEQERYLEIIGFTAYAYLAGKITKYSGIAGGRMRTLGEFMENFIYGKIAEEAFKLFLEKEFGLQTLTEVDIADFYYGTYLPDVVAVKISGSWQPSKFWIDVKEVRRDQKWHLVTASSARARPYDAYVAVWVGLPEEHIIWLVENVPGVKKKMSREWLDSVGKIAEKIDKIPCRITGCVLWGDVSAVAKAQTGNGTAQARLNKKFGQKGSCYFDGKTALYDPDDPSWSGAVVRENIGFALTRLEKASDWNDVVRCILKNKKIILPAPPMPYTKAGTLSKKSGLPPEYKGYSDFREAYYTYFSDQLKEIEKKFGSIKRKVSWFAQPLV